MLVNSIIIDDFYSNPYEVREFALEQEFFVEGNFPANDRTGVPTAEGFVSYGGGIIDSKPISRIFKSHYWQSGETYDSSAFVWKCGHFAARKSDSGASTTSVSSTVTSSTSSLSFLASLRLINLAILSFACSPKTISLIFLVCFEIAINKSHDS